MRKIIFGSLAATALFAVAPALAQNAHEQQNKSPQADLMTTNANTNAENANAAKTNVGDKGDAKTNASVRARIADDLKKAGFTDLKVTPDSFIVRAKDKTGNPVVMMIDPDSLTEISEVGANTGNPSAGEQQANSGTGKFTNVPSQDELGSKAIGLDVYNSSNQDIGTIKDVAIENNNVKAYILGVGGFLGVGERYVAVNPSAINLSYNANDKKWRAEMNVTKDELKSAPKYDYPSTM